MKKAFAVVIACIACFALGYYINKESTDKQLRERYQLEYLDAVKELDEDYSERLEKEKEKSYQKGYNIGIREGKQKAEAQSDVKYVEVPKFYSSGQEEMYDEIWDEIYEQAREDAYEQAREDIECEFDVDLDY